MSRPLGQLFWTGMSRPLVPAAKRRRPGTGAPPLSEPEQLIYDLIMSKGNDGILLRGVKFESKLADTVINKTLKSLMGKELIKEVKSIKHTGRKVYMGANCMPSKEVSGGVWYDDGKLDQELVGALKRFCIKHLRDCKVDTLEGIHKAVQDGKMLTIEIPMPEMAELLTSMVLEDEIIEVKSTGMGIYYGLPVGITCYRISSTAAGGAGKSSITGAFASIPCGMCPRISLCTPDGAISPATCVYFNKWLDIKINKP